MNAEKAFNKFQDENVKKGRLTKEHHNIKSSVY